MGRNHELSYGLQFSRTHIIKWGASFLWSSNLYCRMQNSGEITIGKTQPALQMIWTLSYVKFGNRKLNL